MTQWSPQGAPRGVRFLSFRRRNVYAPKVAVGSQPTTVIHQLKAVDSRRHPDAERQWNGGFLVPVWYVCGAWAVQQDIWGVVRYMCGLMRCRCGTFGPLECTPQGFGRVKSSVDGSRWGNRRSCSDRGTPRCRVDTNKGGQDGLTAG